MRTTLDIESEVLAVAKSLASARGISVGAALSELARRGFASRTPTRDRNGIAVFQLPAGSPVFGPDDVAKALETEDLQLASQFISPVR
ncbi:MAG: antitoxin [Acidobacteria bacterium]|nr:antitoxin [Acidobacteriota bacterium]